MTRPRVLLLLAFAMQLVAWFVPVHRDGITLRSGLPGWEAWWFSTTTVLHPIAEHITWWLWILCAVSSLSTALFLLAVPFLLWKRKLFRFSAWIAALSCVVNAHWIFTFASTWSELRPGYYLWWLSFGVLSAAFFAQAHHDQPLPAPKAKARAATAH